MKAWSRRTRMSVVPALPQGRAAMRSASDRCQREVSHPETWPARVVKLVPRLLPRSVAPETMARAMRPTIRPYSIAVAPRWDLLKRASFRFMMLTPEVRYPCMDPRRSLTPDPLCHLCNLWHLFCFAAGRTFIRHGLFQPYPPFGLWPSQLKVGQTFETMRPAPWPSG